MESSFREEQRQIFHDVDCYEWYYVSNSSIADFLLETEIFTSKDELQEELSAGKNIENRGVCVNLG